MCVLCKNMSLKWISATLRRMTHPEAGPRRWGEKQPGFQSWGLTGTLHVSFPPKMANVVVALVKHKVLQSIRKNRSIIPFAQRSSWHRW